MELKQAKAKPIAQEGRFLILLFGPDKDLKAIAAHVRARYAGHSVNIRATDNPLDAYAEHTPCESRIIVDNANGRAVAKLYDEAGLSYSLMRWDGEILRDSSGEAPAEIAPVSDSPILRLSDGSIVDRDEAITKAAKALGMTKTALSSMDDTTIIATVELALNRPKRGRAAKPKPEPQDLTTE